MKTSEKGIQFIKDYESLKLQAYLDQGGVWTIGWGSTGGIKPHMKIDLETAEALLARDIAIAENGVRRLITVPLKQNQFDALVSFTFNCGVAALQVSTLRKLLNKGQYENVPGQMLRWNKVKVDGEYIESNGLTKRRRREGELFLSA